MERIEAAELGVLLPPQVGWHQQWTEKESWKKADGVVVVVVVVVDEDSGDRES